MDYELLSKFFAGELTEREKEVLLDALGEDANMLEEAARLKNSWAVAQLAAALDDKKIARKGLNRFRAGISRHKSLILKRWQIAVAAAVAGIIFAASFFAGRIIDKPVTEVTAYHTLSVPAGQYAQLTLSDGSEIWLNAGSKLVYPERFTSAGREIRLEGEGLFKVAADRTRPFTVKTEYIDVRATGTQFTVSAYEDDDRVSAALIEGVVSIYGSDNHVEHKVKAGHIAVYDKSARQISEQAIDTEMYTSWINGEYRFKETALSELTKRLERYYNIHFVFLDETVKQRKFSGAFYSNQSVDTILKVIETSANMSCSLKQDTVYIAEK
ncbi:MAG: FecR domain-containing protein [Tannerella sp.]|jgi:ferric-dicitrate binding protein FerR (iron transport regulator)|nr:FecR domain-containing protein [Tannerella sp.]